MKNFNFTHTKALLLCLTFVAAAVPTAALTHSPTHTAKTQNESKGIAVAYPWVFKNGNETSRTMAVTTAEEILRKAGYSSVPTDVAANAWNAKGYAQPKMGSMPSRAKLAAFGKSLHASKVLYGSVSWHTRSIWVNAGPKTISTATVNAYVLDVKTGKVVYTKKSVEGRSDEKSNGYKIAADILITPLVTAVSGGPSTPQEQRAVQIGLALAYQPWVGPLTTIN